MVAVYNGSAANVLNVTLEAVPHTCGRSVDEVAASALPVKAVGLSGTYAWIPFIQPSMFNSTGVVTITLDQTSDVFIGAFRMKKTS
jgi:hypothetical protein